MPRLDRMGLDERTLGVLASLPVPITLGKVPSPYCRLNLYRENVYVRVRCI